MKRIVLIGILTLMGLAPVIPQSLRDTISIEEVVVTGSKIEVARSTIPVNVSVINSEEINEIEESAILPLISRRIPGVFVTERAVTGFSISSNSAGQISVRGVGGTAPNTQVLVLVDGHPQYMGIFGHPFPNSYVASDLERVEVIRGPASILYGSNAMGGVLNFITKEQKNEGFTGSLRASYGSFNTSKMMANTGFKKGKFDVFLSYNRDNTTGHRDNSDFTINNGYVKAGYELNDHIDFRADLNIARFNSMDPGPEYNPEIFTADILRGKASFSAHNKFDLMEGGLLLFYNYGDHELSDGWISNDENYGLSFYQGLRLFNGSLITAGFDYKNFGGRGNAGFPPNANKWLSIDERAAYLVAQQNLSDQFVLNGGLRVENNSEFGTELIPQGGISFMPAENTTLKASVSKGFRSPTIMETYLFAPNPDLEPEKLMSYEASLNQYMLDKKLRTEITFFLVNGTNIIMMVPSDNPPPPMTRINTGDFSHKGLELEAYYNHSGSLSADLTYSYLSMEESKLAAPKHQLYAGINYRIGDFLLALQANYIGDLLVASEAMSGDEALFENYGLVNASIHYKPLSFIEIFLSGKNLTDTDYQINYGYPMPGIHLMTGLGITF